MNYYRYKTELIDQRKNKYHAVFLSLQQNTWHNQLKREEICFSSQFLKGCPWFVVLGHVGGRISITE